MSLTPLQFPRITDSFHGVHVWHGSKMYITQNRLFAVKHEEAGWAVRFIGSSVGDRAVYEAFYENKLHEVIFPRRRDAITSLEALLDMTVSSS